MIYGNTLGEKMRGIELIVIGASTGGTTAVSSIIKDLPYDMPGIVVVQHMPAVFTDMYAVSLERMCPFKVREAKHGDFVQSGRVYIAPGGDEHTKVVKTGQDFLLHVEKGEKVSGHCPSVDVLFDSVSKICSKNVIGILLTGMGADGARGLLNMRRAGCYTIGQDESSSVVYGMPKVAFDIGGVCRQLPLGAIAGHVTKYVRSFR